MKQLVVTAAVIVRDDRILMAQRRTGDREGGKWEFPGGKVEFGEDPRAGLERELREELGIEVEVGAPLDVVAVNRSDLQLILLYFGCRIIAGTPLPIECQAVTWRYPEEIDGLEKPPADHHFWERNRGQLAVLEVSR
ncbi:8-oxo-dGTP diphosphatase [Hydrogenispora ethanolica]|uniref:8-oxo-dGTP diphosphatase n=1 Tax=Hydrogenispora ethanolica TaxID=1082276 RepID=A0A4R1RY42_HYDET|nr:(deoxy)nucleoside triphosphate pyrophosphohydrolase [Hydrogenispora ethanolica]TCL71671.1 8-oxo-dGTP diphosphatase [Hydrogenispora ethanolica]